MNKRDFIYISLILICFFFLWNGCEKSDSFEKMIVVKEDSLQHTRNAMKQQITTTALLYGKINDFKKLRSSDSSTITKLQKLVNKLTISATYLKTVTDNNITSVTGTIVARDTIKKDSLIYIYPEYSTNYSNRYERFNAKANKDSFNIQYKVFNEFELVQKWKRNGIFKRKTPIAEITNLNPHTETLEYKTFTIQENKSNRLRDVLMSVAVSAIVTQAFNTFQLKIPIRIK
ncbi:MAG: hypothetical protein ACT4ON_15950 [Bacteroidota bacterium]